MSAAPRGMRENTPRAPRSTVVCPSTSRLIGRISPEVLSEVLEASQREHEDRERLRYIQLNRGLALPRQAPGWGSAETVGRLRGDRQAHGGVAAFECPHLKHMKTEAM